MSRLGRLVGEELRGSFDLRFEVVRAGCCSQPAPLVRYTDGSRSRVGPGFVPLPLTPALRRSVSAEHRVGNPTRGVGTRSGRSPCAADTSQLCCLGDSA